MKRKYEGLLILNTRGKDESADAIVGKLSREIEAEGARMEQIDHIGKRTFPHASKGETEGYYVNFIFNAASAELDKVKSKLRLNADVHQQHYQRLG